GAYPGAPEAALVIDHLSSDGVTSFAADFGDPLLTALGDDRPHGIFIDSLELIGDLPWTADLRATFADQFGYDLTPYLPLLFRQSGESKYVTLFDPEPPRPIYSTEFGERVREDYEDLRARLFAEQFVQPVSTWASDNDLQLRLQAHGGWGQVLDDYAAAHIPEAEGLYAGGSYDFLKLASSAAHVAGRPIASSESFVAFVASPDAITLDDLYLLAGRALSAGINRFIQHGHPYPLTQDSGSWYPFELPGIPFSASTRLSSDSPLWPELPAFNRYLARLSYIMTRGQHRAQVAWLLADREIPDRSVLNLAGFPPEEGESALTLALKRGGYVHDRISRQGLLMAEAQDGVLTIGSASYRALLIDDLQAASVELMEQLIEVADAGVPIIVLGDLPQRARGFR
ncbi:MAG: glycosyl hydrolase, partial [Myxococcota bacterium]